MKITDLLNDVKGIFLVIAGLFAVLPGLPALLKANILPETNFSQGVYIALVELICVSVFLLVLLNRNTLKLKSTRFHNRIIIVSLISIVIVLLGYNTIYNRCMIFQEDEFGGSYFMPLITDDPLSTKIELYKSRQMLVNMEPDMVQDYIDAQPNSDFKLHMTYVFHVVLYILFFLSIILMFSFLSILYLKREEKTA